MLSLIAGCTANDGEQDIIKFHGWQIAPAELEAVLLTHPQVVNAAVVGIPLKDGTGERPQAFVVLKPRPLDGSYASHGELEEPTTTEEELKTYLSSRLAKYKALNGVTFVEDIPRTPSGKLQKFKLRERYLERSDMDVSKRKRRKDEALETIADRNSAFSDGAADPIIGSTDTSGRDHDAKAVSQKGLGKRSDCGNPLMRKRVKITSNDGDDGPSSEESRVITNGNEKLSNGYSTGDDNSGGHENAAAFEGKRGLGNGHPSHSNGSS